MKYNYPFIKIPIDWYICENSDENPTQMCCDIIIHPKKSMNVLTVIITVK